LLLPGAIATLAIAVVFVLSLLARQPTPGQLIADYQVHKSSGSPVSRPEQAVSLVPELVAPGQLVADRHVPDAATMTESTTTAKASQPTPDQLVADRGAPVAAQPTAQSGHTGRKLTEPSAQQVPGPLTSQSEAAGTSTNGPKAIPEASQPESLPLQPTSSQLADRQVRVHPPVSGSEIDAMQEASASDSYQPPASSTGEEQSSDATNYGVQGDPNAPKYIYRRRDVAQNDTLVYGTGAPAPAFGGTPQGFGTVGQPESYRPGMTGGEPTTYVTGANGPMTGRAQAASLDPGAGTSSLPSAQPAGVATVPSAGMAHFKRPEAGMVIEVQPGQTITKIAREYGVSVAALMQTNGLTSPALHPGQKLLMPGKSGRSILPPSGPAYPVGSSEPLANPEVLGTTAPAEPAANEDPGSTYTVRAGDSVFSIARRYGMKPDQLMAANGISDPLKVKLGQVLHVPPGHTLAAAPEAGTKVASLDPSSGTADPSEPSTDEGIPAPVNDAASDETGMTVPSSTRVASGRRTTESIYRFLSVLRFMPRRTASSPMLATS
jgi:LysM repeat protein